MTHQKLVRINDDMWVSNIASIEIKDYGGGHKPYEVVITLQDGREFRSLFQHRAEAENYASSIVEEYNFNPLDEIVNILTTLILNRGEQGSQG